MAGTRKAPAYSPSSSQNLSTPNTTRRSHAFSSNRIQQSSSQYYDTHLPSIRDVNDNVERQVQSQDELHNHLSSKKQTLSTSPKSTGRPPSTSISSIFNTLAKRSAENITGPHGDFEETGSPNPISTSRRLQQSSKAIETNHATIKQIIVPQKLLGDNGVDVHVSNGSGDTNNQRAIGTPARIRNNMLQINIDSSYAQESLAKERNISGTYIII